MSASKTTPLFLGAAVAVWALAAQAADKETAGEQAASTVTAQETPGKTLAERVPPVTGQQFHKRHRVELYPQLGWSQGFGAEYCRKK